ncbi:hypothetical protein LTR53_016581 [Teratosphaeriaceae sp. CCFEE 6253]|nr:hypothetical protein LTR53_016581 [Teratosphaeriaceae sp. CCFEE 6253]
MDRDATATPSSLSPVIIQLRRILMHPPDPNRPIYVQQVDLIPQHLPLAQDLAVAHPPQFKRQLADRRDGLPPRLVAQFRQLGVREQLRDLGGLEDVRRLSVVQQAEEVEAQGGVVGGVYGPQGLGWAGGAPEPGDPAGHGRARVWRRWKSWRSLRIPPRAPHACMGLHVLEPSLLRHDTYEPD